MSTVAFIEKSPTPSFSYFNFLSFLSSCFSAATTNRNGLLSQKLCHYLDQGRTLNDILLRATQQIAYFDLSKLNLT